MIRKSRLLFGTSLFALAATQAFSAALTAGNIVAVRVGDGAAALSSAGQAIFLDEFTPAGVLVQSIALPNTGASKLVMSGSATSEGTLNYYGGYFAVAGYNADLLTPTVASTLETATPRVVGTIDLSGTVQIHQIGGAYSGNGTTSAGNARSAITDGTTIWTAGQGGSGQQATAGVRATPFGGGASVQLSAQVTNTRVVRIFGGQLYLVTGSGNFNGLNKVGTGLPTVADQVIELLPGFPDIPSGTNNASPYDVEWLDANNILVADDRTQIESGVQKWQFNGTVWIKQYSIKPAANLGVRSIAVKKSGSDTILYATGTDSKIYTTLFQDTGLETLTELVAPVTNTVFRSVEVVPAGSVQPKKISGTVTFDEGYAGTAAVAVTFTIVGNVTESVTVNVDPATGTYTFNLPNTITSGTAEVAADASTFLIKKNNVTISASGASNVDFALINGDIDNDNAVTVFDYGVLSDYFDKSEADSDWNTVGSNGSAPKDADLDADGAVTVFDYGILSNNFDKSGD